MADGGDVVKRITITANGEGIDSTTSSVNALGDAFDNASKKSQSAFEGVGTAGAIGGLIAGLSAALDYVAKMNSGLADMATVAHQVGLSLKDLQSVQFGGQITGLSSDKINTGLQQSATLLNDASRNANSLSKEFDANGISVKNANGQLISQNQLLTIAARLVANAKNPGDQNAIAVMLGFTKEWIPLLEEVAKDGIGGIGDEAKKAGAVIDDSVIERAKVFDEEWKKSSASFSLTMKAAMADLLPYIDDLIKKAKEFVDEVKKGQPGDPSSPYLNLNNTTDKIANNAIRGGLKAVGIDPDQTWQIKIAPELTSAWDSLSSKISGYVSDASDDTKSKMSELVSWWKENVLDLAIYGVPKALNQATSGAFPAKPVTVGEISKEDRKWYTGTNAVTDTSDDTINAAKSTAAWVAEGKTYQQLSSDITKGAEGIAGGFSKVASKGNDANDAVDRAINTLTRHVGQQEADAKAIGLGDAALAALKAEANETAAVLANGGKETDAQALKFATLKSAAYDAADALAKAKVASEISRGAQTAFLSPEDVQIANQLAKMFGDNIPAALNSSQAAAIRLNNAMASANNTIRTGLATSANEFVSGLVKGESVMQSLKSAAASLGQTLTTAGVNSLVTTGLNSLTGAAGLSAGAASAAAAITAACTAGGAALAAGGATAAAAIGTGGVTAGAAEAAGGAAAGTTTAVGGAAAGTSLAAGGAAAGAALWGPIGALVAAGAGIGLSLFGGSNNNEEEKNKQAIQQAQQAQAAAISAGQDRASQYNTQGQLAGVDTSTVQGQLQAFDIQANKQRADEMKSGGEAIVELEKSLAAQRQAIVDKANQQVIKSYQDFLDSVKTGSLSTLSPEDQLKYAQNLFNSDVTKAKGGDQDAIDKVTQDAQSLLNIAQSFYASSAGYASIYDQVTGAVSGLISGGGLYTAAPDAGITNIADNTDNDTASINKFLGQAGAKSGYQPVGTLPGYASGGIVGNGSYNRDSVTARLAGGEAVTRATSVNARTIGALQYINNTGRAPQGDNTEVVRVLTQGFNNQTQVLSDKLDSLSDRIKAVESATKQAGSQRRVPGSDKRAA